MKVSIIDYSLTDLDAIIATNSNRPEPTAWECLRQMLVPNTFAFSFTRGDVAAAAIELGIIAQPWDLETDSHQEFRIAYQMAGENGNPQYFTYTQMVEWISGEDREAIVLNLAMQQPEISNRILAELI